MLISLPLWFKKKLFFICLFWSPWVIKHRCSKKSSGGWTAQWCAWSALTIWKLSLPISFWSVSVLFLNTTSCTSNKCYSFGSCYCWKSTSNGARRGPEIKQAFQKQSILSTTCQDFCLCGSFGLEFRNVASLLFNPFNLCLSFNMLNLKIIKGSTLSWNPYRKKLFLIVTYNDDC